MSTPNEGKRTGSISSEKNAQIMIFRSESFYFGSRLDDVEEILIPMPLTPIPFSNPYVLGMGYRGRFVFPVIDLLAFLRCRISAPESNSNVYVLFKSTRGYMGVAVDGLVQIESQKRLSPEREGYTKPSFAAMNIPSEALHEVGTFQEQPLPLINFQALLDRCNWIRNSAA